MPGDERTEEDPVEGEPEVPKGDGAGGTSPAAPRPSTWAGRAWRVEADGERTEEDERPEQDEERSDADGEPGGATDELRDEDAAEVDADELDQATVEADTLALADREAAREAALAGIRARAAQHVAKQAPEGGGAPAATAQPEAAELTESAEEAGGGEQVVEAEEAAEPEEAPPAEVPPSPTEPEPQERPPRRGLWARFLAGSLLIMVSMATATAVSLLVYLTDFARGLGGLPSVRSQLQVADPGNPQTILILGSDKRATGQEVAHSDTTILLRVAPSQISIMSIPRDLKVNIPGHGIDKFNVAYTYGGPKLTLKVVKQLTGLDNINHVVNVDFTGFADAVNAIGCVYIDVDRHYYHSNVGLATEAQYAEIDIPAGYQRMCGLKALQYVRYRHDDNDLVRAARQQEFLRETRQELPPAKLLSDRNTLIDILKRYVTSDIEQPETIIGLGRLFLAARNASVVQVHFPATLGGANAAYVTASESAIREAVQKFEGEAPSPPEHQETTEGGSGSEQGGAAKKQAEPAPPPLIDATSLGRQYAAGVAKAKTESGRPMLDFPVSYPTKLAPNSTLTDDSRAFPIDGPGDEVDHGYKLVASVPSDGYTAYYGFSGTDWKDPPILANPDETKTLDGRDYLLSWDGGQLRLVGWRTDRGSYWIDNTLLNVLSPGQMLGIAQSMRRYTG